MLAHVTSKLKSVDAPIFSAYPLAVKPPPWSLARLFFKEQNEYTPDLTIFALDHPAFGSSPDSLWERLSALHAAYSGFTEDDFVVLVEPEEDRVVKMQLIEFLGEEQCRVALGNPGSLAHFGSRSERVVPKDSLFGGFPCTVLLPSTPVRLLKNEIAGSTREDLGMWPARLEATDVSFLCDGEPVDDEVGLGRLMAWAESYDVRVCIGDERVPFAPG